MLTELLNIVRMLRVLLSCWGWIALYVFKISVNFHQILETAHCATMVLSKCQTSRGKTTKFYHVIEDLKYDIKLGTISQVVRCFGLYIGLWEMEVCIWAILLYQLMLLEYLRTIVRSLRVPTCYLSFCSSLRNTVLAIEVFTHNIFLSVS